MLILNAGRATQSDTLAEFGGTQGEGKKRTWASTATAIYDSLASSALCTREYNLKAPILHRRNRLTNTYLSKSNRIWRRLVNQRNKECVKFARRVEGASHQRLHIHICSEDERLEQPDKHADKARQQNRGTARKHRNDT